LATTNDPPKGPGENNEPDVNKWGEDPYE